MSKQLRQRRGTKEEEKVAPTFADHAADDAAIQEEEPATEEDIEEQPNNKGLTGFGRVVLFLVFPFLVGTSGLYAGYIRKMGDPSKKIDFDNDFVFPFLLALTMVLVIGFNTGGFTSKKAKPLVAWPKVRRRKKVIHKRVIVDDDELQAKED
jgi:hypothetical protein